MTFEEFMTFIGGTFPDLTPEQTGQFLRMEALYRDWNSRINVISRKDIDGLYSHHVLHSLAIAAFLKFQFPGHYDSFLASSEDRPTSVLDLGTGGGFPGIPLAILFPGVRFTLCDSIGKKTVVASEVARELGLKNVKVVNARAESLGEKFDFIVSRAVTSLENFIPWVKGKYSQGILYLKGGDVVEEISMAMGRFRLPEGSVHTWNIDNWIPDPFFNEKMVIFIEK
ncbi:MAG: 16S rRNA (guanine(527)-N(7))-methyltransferase RsmG [Candidatus Cryptobacteroides sp.]